jgi:preprotein translocase subunit SecD
MLGVALLAGCSNFQTASKPKIDPTKFALYEQPIDMRFHFATDQPTDGYLKVTDPDGQTAYVEPIPLLTEQDVVSARAQHDSQDRPCVLITFNDAAGARLSEITAESIGEKMAIFVDDELVSCPKIMSAISTKAQISGNFTEERAQQIASALTRRSNR